jgi:D-3-phosphoglycerate dehydrogenase
MKVLFIGFPPIVHPWYDHFLEAVNGRFEVSLFNPEESRHAQMEGVEVVVEQAGGLNDHEQVDLAADRGVKLWQFIGTGLNHVDTDYIRNKGICMANTPGQFSAIALAEHALFLMLYILKNFPLCQKSMHEGLIYEPMVDELAGRTLGLIGFGASARALASRARALEMRLMATDAAPVSNDTLQELGVDFFGLPDQMDRIWSEADVVSIHLPLTDQTRHLIDRRTLNLMKPTAVLINVARGEIIQEAALIEVLQNKQIKGAGLDVVSHEPIDPDNPLLSLGNVVVTNHIAGVTSGTSRRRGQAAAENIMRVSRGETPLYVVD